MKGLMSAFIALNVFLYRLSDGRVMGKMGRAPILLLTSTGRKSGQKTHRAFAVRAGGQELRARRLVRRSAEASGVVPQCGGESERRATSRKGAIRRRRTPRHRSGKGSAMALARSDLPAVRGLSNTHDARHSRRDRDSNVMTATVSGCQQLRGLQTVARTPRVLLP